MTYRSFQCGNLNVIEVPTLPDDGSVLCEITFQRIPDGDNPISLTVWVQHLCLCAFRVDVLDRDLLHPVLP